LRDVLTVDDNAARCRCIETGNQAEQSALAASRRAHDGDELSGGNVKREVANDLNFVRCVPDGLDEISDNNHDLILDENGMHSSFDVSPDARAPARHA